ncbi:hypothetical protein Tco_1182079 [Tanacetum coccineum]
MMSSTRRSLFPKAFIQMDTDTDENSDDDEDLDVEKKFDEFDDEIENIDIECESKTEDFKGKEGMPCHLYFDLEFNIKENAEKNGDEMIDILILIIFECLLEKYNIEGDTNWIVVTPRQRRKHENAT